jgi:hypothetical protein
MSAILCRIVEGQLSLLGSEHEKDDLVRRTGFELSEIRSWLEGVVEAAGFEAVACLYITLY